MIAVLFICFVLLLTAQLHVRLTPLTLETSSTCPWLDDAARRPLNESSAWNSRENNYGINGVEADNDVEEGDSGGRSGSNQPPRTATAATNQADDDDDDESKHSDVIFHSIAMDILRCASN